MSDSAMPRTVAHQAPLPWDSPGKNTGMGNHSPLQGIFPTQGSKPGLPTAGRFFTLTPRKSNSPWEVPKYGFLKIVSFYWVTLSITSFPGRIFFKLRTRLPMQGTRVWSLLQADSTRCGATNPLHHNYWVHAPFSLRTTTPLLQLEKRPGLGAAKNI